MFKPVESVVEIKRCSLPDPVVTVVYRCRVGRIGGGDL